MRAEKSAVDTSEVSPAIHGRVSQRNVDSSPVGTNDLSTVVAQSFQPFLRDSMSFSTDNPALKRRAGFGGSYETVSKYMQIRNRVVRPGVTGWSRWFVCACLVSASGCGTLDWFKKDATVKDNRQSQPAMVRPPNPNPAEPIVDSSPVKEIKVSGEIITLEKVLGPLKPTLKTDAATLNRTELRRKLQTTVGEAIGRTLDEVLLYQQAMADLTEEEEKYLEKFVDQIIREEVQKEHGGRQAAYERHLVQRGMTLADAREKTRRELMIQRFLGRKVFPKVADPTRAELLSYYEEIKDELSKAERREMFLIEVPIENENGKPGSRPDEDAQRAARARIDAAMTELNNGAPFASIASTYSKGVNADNGGAWGWVTREGVRERWQPAVQALYTLAEGSRSGIIETPEAYFIVQCGKVEGSQSADFVKMQGELMERYKKAQQGMLYNELLNKLRDRAGLDPNLMDRFLRSAVDEAEMMASLP